MSRYIDAEKLDTRERGNNSQRTMWNEIKRIVDNAPTADVKEVIHGEWELKSRAIRLVDDFDEDFYVECSVCHRTEEVEFEFDEEKMLAYAREHYPFCHCGADMRPAEISETNN